MILLHSVIDLAFGILEMPLFILNLASGIGEFSNCVVAALTLRLTHLAVGASVVIYTNCYDIAKIH